MVSAKKAPAGTQKKRKRAPRKNLSKRLGAVQRKLRVAIALCVLLSVSFAVCLGILLTRQKTDGRSAAQTKQEESTADQIPSSSEILPTLPAPAQNDARVEKTPASESAQASLSANPSRPAPQKPPPQTAVLPTVKPQPAIAKTPPPEKKPNAGGQSDGKASTFDTLPGAMNGAALIFVFDDAGQNLSQLSPFLTLPFPLTIAVLPRLPHSADAADKIRGAGKEVILHQPMQARNRAIDPGPGAIAPGMGAEEIKAIAQKNIAEIAPIAGMNNHEGSLITESREAMIAVLDVCKTAGIYFLDSRTTAATAVPAAARARGMEVRQRDIFLDNTPSKDDMLKELTRGLGIANKTGSVIMIGHVWSPALAELLRDLYPVLLRKGYTFATISAQ